MENNLFNEVYSDNPTINLVYCLQAQKNKYH